MSDAVFRREDLLGEFQPRIEKYRLADGREVWVRNLSALEHGELELAQLDLKTGRNSKEGLLLSNARLIARCLVDGPEGRRIFTPDDAATIAGQDHATVVELATICERHCGRRLNVEDEAKN